MNPKNHIANLLEIADQLTLVKTHLKASFNNCLRIASRDLRTEEDLIQFEVLTSRFARASDILIQKVYRSIDAVELTETGTLLDALNRAEKRQLIDSVAEMRLIRDLRNDIAHEYITERLWLVHEEVFEMVPKLLDFIQRATSYAKKYGNNRQM